MKGGIGWNLSILGVVQDPWEFYLMFAPFQGRTRGGGPGTPWGLFQYYICLHFPSSGNLNSTLHCTHTNKKIKKWNKLYSNSHLQSFVWSSISLNIHVSHFENWLFLFVVSLQKWLAHFLLQKRWRNESFKGTSDMPLYKWRVTIEITPVFHFHFDHNLS